MKTKEKINVVEEEWLPSSLEDDERIYMIKSAIQELRPVERKIFLTYVEGGTYTSVAKAYSVSVPTAKKYIETVKNKIKKILEDDNRIITD